MYISPTTLQDYCVNFICDNLPILCENYNDIKNRSVSDPNKLKFKDSDVYFHSEISERLLKALCAKGKLNDSTLTLFDVGTTRLRYDDFSYH